MKNTNKLLLFLLLNNTVHFDHNCFNELITNYFIETKEPINFIIPGALVKEHIVPYFAKNFEFPYLILDIKTKDFSKLQVGKKYIVHILSVQNLKDVISFSKFTNTRWDHDVIFLIFLVYNIYEIGEIFDVLKMEDINAIIMLKSKIYFFKSVFSPFNNQLCCYENITIISNKIRQTYHATYIDFRPFKNNAHFLNVVQRGSVELNIIEFIRKFLKFSLKIKLSNSPYDLGNVLDNGSLVGDFQYLENGTDIALAGYQLVENRYKRFHTTFPHVIGHFAWIVPSKLVKLNLNNWFTIIDSYALFILVGAIIIIIVILGLIPENNKVNSNITKKILTVYSIVLGVSTQIPKTDILRVILAAVVFINFFLNSFFSTILFSFLSDIRYAQEFDIAPNVFNSDLELYIHHSYINYFSNTNKKKLKITYNINECFKGIADGKRYGCLKTKLFLNYLANFYTGKGKSKFYVAKKSVAYHPFTIYTRRGFPLYKNFSDVVFRLWENGFILKEMEGDNKRSVDRQTAENDFLKMKHLKPVLFVILCGYGTSIVIFIAEVVFNKYR